VLIIILLCCSAFFSGSETAIFSLSHVKVHELKESRHLAGRMLASALERPREILITILLGNELSNVSLSIVSAALIAHTFARGPVIETAISVALVTPLVLILGEIIPKNLALKFAPSYAQATIIPLKLFSTAVYPLRRALTAVANLFISLFGGKAPEHPIIMEQEYRKLVDLGRREGVIIEEEREIIHSIFEFSDKVVSSIMTPAEHIFSLPVEAPYETILDEIKSHRHSRVPFYAGDNNNIVGILHVRDLFAFDRKRSATGEGNIRTLLRTPLFATPNRKLEELLKDFQEKRIHMAVVRGAGDIVEGIVTMDDVLEDIFGEIEV
jgi:putative hemolysin